MIQFATLLIMLLIRHNLKALSLKSELKNGSYANSDKDGLNDWEEFDSDNPLLAWDDNGEPVFPSFTTVSKMVSGFSMSDRYVRELSGISEFLDNDSGELLNTISIR